MATVWVTRAQPGAAATAKTLISLGHEPLIAPLLEVRRLSPRVNLAGVIALAFTSANGVDAFAALSRERSLPVYAVGEATAEAARAAGFVRVENAAGDVAKLAHLIAHNHQGLLLSPGAAERAGDLEGALAAAGIAARMLAVYETLPLEPPEGFDPEAADVVLVHSPKAGRRLAQVLAQSPAPHLRALCISLAAAAALAATPLDELEAAERPDEAALLALI